MYVRANTLNVHLIMKKWNSMIAVKGSFSKAYEAKKNLPIKKSILNLMDF